MPFIRNPCMKEDEQRHRIWSVENKRCLVLKKDLSFTFSGEGVEDENSEEGSSLVIATPKKSLGSNSNGWHLQFRTGGKKYVLDVKDGTVTATEFADQIPPDDAAGFVPKSADMGPFEALRLGSDDSKGLGVNTKDKRLTIEEWPNATTLVICDPYI